MSDDELLPHISLPVDAPPASSDLHAQMDALDHRVTQSLDAFRNVLNAFLATAPPGLLPMPDQLALHCDITQKPLPSSSCPPQQLEASCPTMPDNHLEALEARLEELECRLGDVQEEVETFGDAMEQLATAAWPDDVDALLEQLRRSTKHSMVAKTLEKLDANYESCSAKLAQLALDLQHLQAPAAPALRTGGAVLLHGLEKSPELNSQVGTLRQYDPVRARWQVEVSGCTKLFREANLQALAPDQVHSHAAVACALEATDHQKALLEERLTLLEATVRTLEAAPPLQVPPPQTAPTLLTDHPRHSHDLPPVCADGRCKVFVGNVDYATSQPEMHGLFASAGTVSRVILHRHRSTRRLKGSAWVVFSDPASCAAALALDGVEHRGRKLRVAPPQSKGGACN